MEPNFIMSCGSGDKPPEKDPASAASKKPLEDAVAVKKRKQDGTSEEPEIKQPKTLSLILPVVKGKKDEEEAMVPAKETAVKTAPELDETKLEGHIDEIRDFLCKAKSLWEQKDEKKEENKSDKKEEEEEDEDEDEEDSRRKKKKQKSKPVKSEAKPVARGKGGDSKDLLKRGARVLMEPLSLPYYLDTRNQGRFYRFGAKDKREYIRSANHPMRQDNDLSDSSLVVKKNITKLGMGKDAHLGLYPNIFVKLPEVKGKDRKLEAKLPPGLRYDKAIAYKIALATYAAGQTPNLRFLTMKCTNDYHPLIVIVDVQSFLNTYFKKYNLNYGWDSGEPDILQSVTKPFTIFLMHFFVGMLNKMARLKSLNTYITMRSSFGYDTPSIADTPAGDMSVGSFRINLGLMVPAYADLVCLTLQYLSILLKDLIDKNEGMNITIPKIESEDLRKYYKIENYFRITNYKEITDYLQLACFRLETTGKLAITNLLRKKSALDFINASAFNGFNPEESKSLQKAFAGTLQQLFGGMAFDGKTLSTTTPAGGAYLPLPGKQVIEKTDTQSGRIDLLNDLHLILQLTSVQIDALYELITKPGDDIKKIKETIQPNLHEANPYLSVFVDIANEFIYYLILKQLDNPDDMPDISDGYGSDSDFEEDGIAGKKIITHNGMRAILSPVAYIKRLIGSKIALDVNATYYEVQLALDELEDDYITPRKKAAKKKKKKSAPKKAAKEAEEEEEEIEAGPEPKRVVLRDNNANENMLTPRLAQPVKEEISGSEVEYWVIDVTGSTQQKTDELIELLKNDPKKLLFLVSSGFKNEQGGSEKNPYGTVRVFANSKNKEELGKALAGIRETDQGMPGLSHHIRRMHKLIGNVPTNRSIMHKEGDIATQQEKALSHSEVTDVNNTIMLEATEPEAS